MALVGLQMLERSGTPSLGLPQNRDPAIVLDNVELVAGFDVQTLAQVFGQRHLALWAQDRHRSIFTLNTPVKISAPAP